MANNKLLINEKQTELGNFLVGRYLPVRNKRQVGPFTFVDHMGPSSIGPNNYMDVDQHPHIGLSTLTYLLEGAVEHKDSTGSNQIIYAGDVGFMTSGKGVAHTERTPLQYRDGKSHSIHGYQIWVALPVEKEDMLPRFDYFNTEKLPHWTENNCSFKLIAGNAFGKSAPLQGYSPLFLLDIQASETTELNLVNQLKGEVAFIITHGSIQLENETVETGQMLISKTDETCSIIIEKGTRILLFGGEPLPEERFLMWNFVSSKKDKLKQAKDDWQNKRFPKIDGDNTYIPFPELKF